MMNDTEKIEQAKTVLLKIAKGVNPVTGEPVAKGSFLGDPKVIRCIYTAAEVLDDVKNGKYFLSRRAFEKFIITPEQKSRVTFTDGAIGVNEFSRCINSAIDISQSRKLTGVDLNKRLRKLGILSEEKTEEGKTRTVVNQNSLKYGFETRKREYHGREYDQVIINETGKKYLLQNIESIMAVELDKAV